MTVGNFLKRPAQYEAVQWDGMNVSEVNSVLQVAGWSFTGDNGGTAHTATGNSFPVAAGTYVAASSEEGAQFFATDTEFNSRFIAGTSWVVSA